MDARVLIAGVFLGALVVVGPGCGAKEFEPSAGGGTAGSDAGGGGGSSSSGGTTSGGSGGATGGAGGSGGASSDGGLDGADAHGPCNPLAQDCPNGENCLPTVPSECQKAGTKTHGEPCKGSAECAPGHVCFVGIEVCLRLCKLGGGQPDCSMLAGGECTQALGQMPAGIGNCFANECSLLAQDCPNSGESCYLLFSGKECTVPGVVPTNGPCKSSADCTPGNFCLGSDQLCHRLCSPAGGQPDCSGMDGGTYTCQDMGNGLGYCH